MGDNPKRRWYRSAWMIPVWLFVLLWVFIVASDIGVAWYNSRHPERDHYSEEWLRTHRPSSPRLNLGAILKTLG
jgi:hypothetical protein